MKDDQKYLELMALYKRVRKDPDSLKTSQKILELALRMKERGEVSQEASEASRYI